MLRFLRTRALPPVHAHLSFSTKSPPTLPERARIALVGRTNIGKSTLFNRLTKTRGAIVHNVPGTTRDRRFAVVPTNTAKCDREPLVISAEHGEGLTDLVPLLVPLVEGHAEALAVQKAALAAELPAGDTMDELENSTLLNKIVRDDRVLTGPEPGVTRDAVEVKWAFHNREITLVDTAGIRKFSKVQSSFNVTSHHLVAAHDRWDLRVTTGRLNRWMAAMDRHHPPPTVKGKTLKVKYITQVKARPPTFALFVNKADDVPESFLLNQLRTEFDMTGVPARLLLRGSEDNPYKRGYSRAKPTTTTRSTSKPVAFGGRNTSPKAAVPAATGKLKAVPAPWTGKKVPTAKAKVVVRGTRKNKTSGFRGPSSGAKPKNGRGAASRPSSRREPTKKPSSAARGSSSGGRRPAEASSSKGRSSSSSRPSSKPSGGGGKQKGKSSGRHKTERTKLRDPSAKKASRWSDKQKENAKRHNGTRKPRTG
ncbi:hypothetical protein B5M09_000648 [Aphanomyces astaci]|uniref:G domain-containing protein n=1 Tax=Aphanomyces astaci TaxID=112090 RepID=A0A425CS49_APHAT|nr:hypothetical protein B5M09_000648 [Aphanomyces astaci]